MIVASYQGPVSFANAEQNLERMTQALQRAEAAGAKIVCFPETFLHGYFPSEQQASKNAVDLGGSDFQQILKRLANFDPTVLFGLNEIRDGRLYNTVVVVERGKLLGRYSKNYLVFNYFERGGEFPIFERDGVKFGVVICADTSYIEPARILAMKGARILFTPHFNYIGYAGLDDHTWRVRQHHVAIAIDNSVFVVRSNVVVPESQGTEVFGYAGVGVGDSVILNPRGRVLAEAGLCRETLLTSDLPDEQLHQEAAPWKRVSPAVAQALHQEYQKLFARHANIDAPEGIQSLTQSEVV